MKVVGIVKQDYAYAGWNMFQAFRRHGIDARLINIGTRVAAIKVNPVFYDVKMWENRGLCAELIETADVYHIFESGSTISYLNLLPKSLRRDIPTVVSLNTQKYYAENNFKHIEAVKKHGDVLVAMTLGIRHKDVMLGLRCLDANEFDVRQDYTQKDPNILTVGSAPAYPNAVKIKNHTLVKSKVETVPGVRYDMLMGAARIEVHKNMCEKYDIFTHGVSYAGGYGFSMVEAALFGIPCFTYINNEQKDLIKIDGVLPIINVNLSGAGIPEAIGMLKDRDKREYYGKLTAQWARKYHSYEACYNTYNNIYRSLIGD